jgi:hypothetical protein
VIFKIIDNKPIKCKSAKFIRISTLCRPKYHGNNSLTIKSNEVLDLFVLKNNEYETIFYVLNDTIRFIRRKYEEYRNVSIVPLFDYKSGTYNFIGIDEEKFNLTKYNTEPEQFIKTPNGYIYFIVNYTFLELEKTSYRILTINNATTGKVLFSFVEEEYYFIWQENTKIFPTILYTCPIFNSFIVIIRIDDHEKLEKTVIYVVNLIEETVEEIEYDLKGYLIELMYNVEDYLFDLLDEVSQYYDMDADDQEYFTPEKIFQTSKIKTIGRTYCRLVKYQDETPVYDNSEFDIKISLENSVYYTECTFKMECNITLSVYLEGSELNIVMTSDENGYIEVCGEQGIKYDIPSGVVLLHKKYYVSNKHNLNKSQLYSITSLFDKYLIIYQNVYKLNEDGHYEWLYYINSYDTLRLDGMRITYRTDDVYALILPDQIRKKYNLRENCALWADFEYNMHLYFLYDTNDPHIAKMIYWSIINEMIDIHKRQKVIMEFSEYIKEINITELLTNVKNKLQDKNIQYDAMYYIYYFIEETCDLYFFMSLVHYDTNIPAIFLRFLIVKHNILKPLSRSEIIFLSDAYELEINPQLKLTNYHRLLSEIIFKIIRTKDNKIYFNDLTIYSLMTYLSNISKDTKTKDRILSRDSRGYLCGISKRDYAGLFLYDKELMVKDSKTFMDIKDIKFNRQSELKQVFMFYPKNGETYSIVDRYGDILIYHLIINDVAQNREYKKFRLMIKVSTMEIVQTIETIQK